MKRPRLIPASGLCMVAAVSAFAGGMTSAEFLRLGVGAPSAMQGASGAVARDATAVYWNPAGLGALAHADVYASHRALPATMRYSFFGAALPLSEEGDIPGTLGYGLQVLSQGSLERLDNAGNPGGRFSALDMAHTAAWAGQWNRTRAGVSLRWLQQSIDDAKSSTLAAGLGLQQDVGEGGALGLGVENAGGAMKLDSESFALPLTGRAGVGWTFLQKELLLAGDVSWTRGDPARWHAGLAYKIFPPHDGSSSRQAAAMTVRFGYTLDPKDRSGSPGLAAGLALDIGSFRADLAYQPLGEAGDSASVGVGYRFR